MSDSAPLPCGVPQSYVFGPIMFSLYVLPLGKIINRFKIIYYHIKLYVSFSPDRLDKLSYLQNCLVPINK